MIKNLLRSTDVGRWTGFIDEARLPLHSQFLDPTPDLLLQSPSIHMKRAVSFGALLDRILATAVQRLLRMSWEGVTEAQLRQVRLGKDAPFCLSVWMSVYNN